MKRRPKATYRSDRDAEDKGIELAIAFNKVIGERYPAGVSTLDVAVACGTMMRAYIDQAPPEGRAELRARVVDMIERPETRQ